jgi:hypothetical protein
MHLGEAGHQELSLAIDHGIIAGYLFVSGWLDRLNSAIPDRDHLVKDDEFFIHGDHIHMGEYEIASLCFCQQCSGHQEH